MCEHTGSTNATVIVKGGGRDGGGGANSGSGGRSAGNDLQGAVDEDMVEAARFWYLCELCVHVCAFVINISVCIAECMSKQLLLYLF